MNGKLINHPLGHAALIVLLGTLAYANSFGVPFVFDDLESIVRNETIRSLGNFAPAGPGYDFHPRRWVAYLSFALNYRFGGLDVAGYHAANLAIHLGAALLVYALVRLTFRTPLLAASRLAPQAGLVALLAALFFVVHPVQTQAVTYVVQRLTSLCTFFYLLALVLYVWGRVRQEATKIGNLGLGTGKKLSPAPNPQPPVPAFIFAGATLSAVLAMFTKEIAFTLPLAALLCEASFFRGPWRPRLLALAPLLLTLAIIPLLVLTSGELSVEGTLRQARLDIPRTHYLLTQFPVMVTYLRLLIWPAGQNIDYDYPIYTTFFTPPVFFSFLLLTALLACAGWLFHKSSPQPPVPELRLIAFGICWFFLTLAIEAGVVPLPDVIFEHRLYLPSVGLAAALAVTLVLAAQKTAHLAGGRLPLLAATAAIIALGAATWQRNQVWGSEVSLWQDTVNKSPGKVRPLYNYGTYLADHGQPAAALPMLGKVVALDPQHADAWHNLGRAHLLLGQTSEAVPALRTAARLAPHLDNALLNLTSALIRSGEYREAIELLAGARQRTAILPGVLMNLGLAYAALGELAAARGELAALQRLDPNMARTLADVIARAAPAR